MTETALRPVAQSFGFRFDRACAVLLPVFGIRPATARVEVDGGGLRHPNATVTVADAEALAAALRG